MKAVWGIVLSALFVPTLMAQTADQTLYRQAYDAVRANDQARFQQIRARLTHYPCSLTSITISSPFVRGRRITTM